MREPRHRAAPFGAPSVPCEALNRGCRGHQGAAQHSKGGTAWVLRAGGAGKRETEALV